MSKNRGSVLQVVLVIFLILFTSLFSYCTLMTRQYELTRYQKMMNQQRRIEILLRRYWRSTIDQDILLGDTFEMEDSVISYNVDDDGTDYIIDCEITTKSYHYTMQAKINMDSLDMHACTYGH
ncbi:hypothetical protein ACTQXK_08900 [Catenibacterium mitsuokai]|uniref:hypothetical protein n=1 Tax=Catenibacterium mitsuokai TaxID=100886 RepID=UPI001C024297|nr:hypothetical protein [Catenibacterium mitsuokai]MBT9814686.1 hypothetical protein [Catenibacterium mitsuokai]MCI6076240.1 hypothetical protein [Catenibacterium mitsuokai]